MTVTTTSAATSTKRPSRRLAKIAQLVIAPAAVALSALVVAQASYSAYSATTVDPTSNWATGTVALNDDDANAAAFTVTNLKPGDTGTRCIAVTSTGNLGSTVKMYATNQAGTTDLSAYMTLSITQGTGGSFGDCTGFTPLASGADLYNGSFQGFGYYATSYATGIGNWTPTGQADETRTFRLTWALSPSAPDTTQGGTAAGALNWEAQNN